MSSQELGLAALGGFLIALSTSLHLFFKGRITGMSGIYYGLITKDPKSFGWKALFVLATVVTTIVVWEIVGFDSLGNGYPTLFDHPSTLIPNLSKGGYFLAGLLVGLGTKLGNGCTSGHGVCGLPRFSIRSWVYVPIFVVVAMITATFRNYVPFLEDNDNHQFDFKDYSTILNSLLFVLLWVLCLYCVYIIMHFSWAELLDSMTTASTAILFALGLILSGMNKRRKINGFLVLNEDWDVSLLIVLCVAVGVNFLTFYYIIKVRNKTAFDEKLEIPANNKIDPKLVVGGVLFGLGWGLGGLCPGPGYILFPFLTPQISLFWFMGLTIGQYIITIFDKVMEKRQKDRDENLIQMKN